jgi:hypothetical protein
MSKFESARIYFDNRQPWMENSREDNRAYAFGIGIGSPEGSSSDCDALGNYPYLKRRADRLYVHRGGAGSKRIFASMDGQHLCGGDSGGAWTLKRSDGQGQAQFLTFAVHYGFRDWWNYTVRGISIRGYWEWVIGRANAAHVSLACPTSVLAGSGYRYKVCRENAEGNQCVTGERRHRNCPRNFRRKRMIDDCLPLRGRTCDDETRRLAQTRVDENVSSTP